MKRLLQLLVIIVIVLLIWKKGVPWWQEHHGKSASSDTADNSCVALAERASEVWGSGVGRFANPPYDLGQWGSFRATVDVAIAKADTFCNCGDESCTKSKQAMSDLRALVNDLDGSIRGGTEPSSDLVQRQEQIDNAINAARDSLKGR